MAILGFGRRNANVVNRGALITMNTPNLLTKARKSYYYGEWANLNKALAILKMRKGRAGNMALSSNIIAQINRLNAQANNARRKRNGNRR